jgi:hypothetical protein
MTHIVISRMIYEEDDPKFEERLSLYKTLCLPRLRLQTEKNFDIGVLCNRKHAHFFKELGIIPFHRKDKWTGQKPDRFWSCMTKWDELEGLEKYDIQTNLDSDDLVSDRFIERIQSAVQKEIDNGFIGSLHIHFQPRLFELHTLTDKAQRKRYDNKEGSAFFSLYQPDKENYIYIGQDSHRRMPIYMSKSILIGEGYCWICVHDNNDSTNMSS